MMNQVEMTTEEVMQMTSEEEERSAGTPHIPLYIVTCVLRKKTAPPTHQGPKAALARALYTQKSASVPVFAGEARVPVTTSAVVSFGLHFFVTERDVCYFFFFCVAPSRFFAAAGGRFTFLFNMMHDTRRSRGLMTLETEGDVRTTRFVLISAVGKRNAFDRDA